ncbi:DNA polymerase III subunit gamma/tau [Vibrio alginolyticus]|uniref:DNA polymerase III subunit gamma/tau n=1 Tax=Vibrio TaxID=662 RepID=UPI0006A5C058|nr:MULTISPECIES: DNA polymerase III subunit gamma/tau [Vibrio]EGQ8495582.1 DNA polymerase III subunit gamma/tau [Vibrio alginolyticus]EJL6719772.1 DNA polymerase III subunit gamma/tau [Vibrio alginolyticus]EKY4211824.1 DNA polymerase III subunit gamma/tau [Vibrio alginolyticus]ELA7818880.1 DNA polymerase III subunit gamma/tau [Vibrio alginolyticus]ELA8076010.1 DNA polymerase III subunit gamma/tau [Vibrio alginolyticus]
MSYLALARKWRPNQFDQVVGQKHVLTALENALAQNRLHHAYLFSGTRGVGKTSIGRLFAKGLNCETGITATPCGKCDTCREIDEGRFVDLLEIDAASRTKVEDTRELLDNVQYKPARGRFKVYLIDEVHMLSRHSFNALLKTLEEPPEYVKFLLATTDPQKLPVTILSRCLQFHLKPISVDDIHQQLDYILGQEQVSAEPKALGMISHAADGSMRDALSLTDQAIALGNGAVQADIVSHMLGTIDTDQAIHLLESISSKKPQQAMDKIQQLAANGVEWDGLLQQVATQLHRIAMYQALPASLDRAQPDAEKIELLSKALSPQDVQLYYQIALKGREDLTLSPNGRVGLEMIVLRMLAFRPSNNSGANVVSSNCEPASSPAQSTSQPKAAPAQTAAAPRAQQPSPAQSSPQVAPQPSSSSQPEYHASGYETVPPQYDMAPPMSENPAPQHETPPQQVQESVSTPARGGLSGLRHQLRSQRQGLQQNTPQNGGSKKPKAASAQPESVIDRVAQLHGNSAQVSPNSAPKSTEPQVEEAYRWRPSKPVETKVNTKLTPTQLKQALEHEKTPEMAQKLIDESLEHNEWAKLISLMEIPKLVEQLALNSHYSKEGTTVSLLLRSSQAHLNTDRAQAELLKALNTVLGEECHMSIEIGESGETPLELRDRLYQEKLQQALNSLENDPNVQFIERRFAAELDKDSVRPI